MPRNEMKRTGGFFKGVLDGLRLSVTQPVKSECEIEESLKPEHFQVAKTLRHGFPFQPTAIAYDPVQRLLVVGTKNGSLRLFGRPGVDCHVQHLLDTAVIQISFLVNERITCCHLPFQCKWLYIGTERGNVHVVNTESFVLSGYVINWNKAIEISRKSHPGAIVHLSDNPLDPNKLLIGYDTGVVVLWDLRNRSADSRFQCSEYLTSISWHNDGKQFICSHTDGSLTTWNIRSSKPISVMYPHAKLNKDGKPELCKSIYKVEWRTVRGGDSFVIFSGGLPYDRTGQSPSLTIIHGKVTTVLEMEHSIIDFITLCETPWQSGFIMKNVDLHILHYEISLWRYLAFSMEKFLLTDDHSMDSVPELSSIVSQVSNCVQCLTKSK
ncbi:syntaxin-binding protein 5-like [Centruroides sculpturatus]|uniref:syntaxin-binding protein 5-like n=1 Tax=Centruroides sculpturatus TaxID=218467 RepID=UPI000C6DB064|nr:syntaxin-binding protein 5-like [Centruroides sculpturatus]